MTPHETGSTATPSAPHATAPPPRTFDPQGPTLGDLSDAYLQDYQVRQFRSRSTARGRTAHLAAFFGRAARAAALTTHQIRQYQLARRAAGAATGTINREGSVATSGRRLQDGRSLTTTGPDPPSCPATIRSNGVSSNQDSSSCVFGGTCGMP